MLIGEDFDKIELNLWGFDLLEPNAFIGNEVLFILAMYLAFRIKRISNNMPFYKFWFWFFIVFGLGLFIGGFAHLLWNYWGVQGKYLPWLSAIVDFSWFKKETVIFSLGEAVPQMGTSISL